MNSQDQETLLQGFRAALRCLAEEINDDVYAERIISEEHYSDTEGYRTDFHTVDAKWAYAIADAMLKARAGDD